jgi:hypothetical protein
MLNISTSLLLMLGFFAIASASCPDGSISSYIDKSLCYSFQAKAMNFMAAEGICEGIGGKLASIHNAFENSFVNEQATEIFTDSTSDDLWGGATTLLASGQWSWIDGTLFDFTDWDTKQPQNVSDYNCAAITLKDGRWISDNCNKLKPFVCLVKVLSQNVTTTTSPKPVSCKPSWTYYVVNGTTGYCYKAFDNATWIDAENTCKVEFKNSHLASIHTTDEALFVASLAHTSGYKGDCNGYKMAWIGGYTDDYNANWYWTDGTPFNYTKWPGDLNHPFSTFQRSCTLKYLTDECGYSAATFDNWPCERILAKYVCKYSPY